MKCQRKLFIHAAIAWMWLGLAGTVTFAAQAIEWQERRAFCFPEQGVSFDNYYAGSRLNDCVAIGDGEFRITIKPENSPINDSAWYAFHVWSSQPRHLSLHLEYERGTHRYLPKTSPCGVHWNAVSKTACQVAKDKKSATVQLDVLAGTTYVSAQEDIGLYELNAWMDRMASFPFVHQSVIGYSVQNQPIRELVLTQACQPDHVVVIGRQHPPEVTGSLALMSFFETLTGDDDLVNRFRATFQVTLIPLVNPDGVLYGHWRHNVNGVDLNRDWSSFQQPETRAIRDEVHRLQTETTGRLYLFLDFHSTHNDLFYVEKQGAGTFPDNFTRIWLEAVDRRLDGPALRLIPSNGMRATSQTWAAKTLGVASVTCEFGDTTRRDLIRQKGHAMAIEMMRTLLQVRQ